MLYKGNGQFMMFLKSCVKMKQSPNSPDRDLTSFNNSPKSLNLCSAALKLLHNKAAGWRVGEYCPNKNVSPPQSVSDHSAAAQVLDLETQVAVPVIGLKQCVVGVRAKELEKNTHIYHVVI